MIKITIITGKGIPKFRVSARYGDLTVPPFDSPQPEAEALTRILELLPESEDPGWESMFNGTPSLCGMSARKTVRRSRIGRRGRK